MHLPKTVQWIFQRRGAPLDEDSPFSMDVVGDRVRITAEDHNILALAEVEIFGHRELEARTGEEDCNENGIFDDAEGLMDCDGNGIWDVCEIHVSTEHLNDCNHNGILDVCDTDDDVDCDGDGTLDECQLARDSSLDANDDGFLDECVVLAGNNWRVIRADIRGPRATRFVDPGDEIVAEVDFLIRNPSGCPGCSTQFVLGYEDTAVDCLVSENLLTSFESRSETRRFEAPSTPGVYEVLVAYELQRSCDDAKGLYSGDRAGTRGGVIGSFVVRGDGFRRGDANDSGRADLSDAVRIFEFLFLGGIAPTCADAADSNDEGAINITSGVYILNWLFSGGSEPPAPGAESCGDDPSDDTLGCESYVSCS